MSGRGPQIPPVVLIYGLLGVVPFLAPSALAMSLPELRPAAARFLALYAGLILSFLGGARWGLAVARPEPRPGTVSLAMLPTLAGLALLLLPPDQRQLQLLGLGVALALHWLWDLTGPGRPGWYPRLRSLLTAGALVGLLAGAVVLT